MQANLPMPYLMPWFNPAIREQVLGKPFLLVRVLSVHTLFPAHRSLTLIHNYGRDLTRVQQTPQLIQRVTLQIQNGTSRQEKFFVDIFPNELPDFLVPYKTFQHQRAKMMTAVRSLQNITVRSKAKLAKLRVIETGPLEKSHPSSLWMTVVC